MINNRYYENKHQIINLNALEEIGIQVEDD